MDASSTPRRTVRLLLDVTRTSDNRIEGQIATAGAEGIREVIAKQSERR